MLDQIELPAFSPVAANTTVTLNIPVGPTYGKITLVRGGTTFNPEHMTEIRLKLGKTVVRTYRARSGGHELHDINAYYGRTDSAGLTTIHFAKSEMDSLEQEGMLALGTGDLRTVTLEVDIGAATAPTLAAYAEVIGTNEPVGLFEHVYRFPVSSSVAGNVEYPDLPREAYSALHFLKADSGADAGDGIQRVEIELDRVRRYEADKVRGEEYQIHRGRVPQSNNYMHVDFVPRGNIYDALLSGRAADFRARVNYGAAGSLVIIAETVRGLVAA